MSQANPPRDWWDLHLRKARGEPLSEEEQRAYEAELARQDRDAPPLLPDLDSLKKMREQVRQLARSNAELNGRARDLEQAIQRVEQSLSRETRQALGVED
jgi:hypothetical protein